MRVLALTVPGRFPTVVHDPGLWWDTVAATGAHDLRRFSANFAWWRSVCSPQLKGLMLAPLRGLDRLRRRAEWRAGDIALDAGAAAAGRALEALTTPQPFRSVENYLAAMVPIARHLETLNRAQPEFEVILSQGPRVRGLNYNDSATLVAYSRTTGLLAQTIAAACAQCPIDIGFIAVSVTSQEDLLTAMIAAQVLRARNPGVHVSLIDHGYENFSLHAHMDALRRAGTLDRVFDSIVVAKDERDDLVPDLIEAVAAGHPVRGYLTRADLPAAAPRPAVRAPAGPARPVPPPVPTFAPEPIFWTRLSARRCYWSRCTYCTQNNRYDNPRAPAQREVLQSLDRVERLIGAGYKTFYFSDEAVSPATLRVLANEIERRRLAFRWACRCKLERAHDAELFARLGKAGCYEILYGLESTSPRVLRLMDKYTQGLDEPRIAETFRAMERAGIGVHVNLIGGFPGETVAEVERSVEFVIGALSQLRGSTYVLNRFAMFADTPIANAPERFGVARVTANGDIAQTYGYELTPEIAAASTQTMQALPRLRQRLDAELGWGALARTPGGLAATVLYFSSGHGAIFKVSADNPFAAPLQAQAFGAARAAAP